MNSAFTVLSVTQLNTYVRSVLEADRNLSSVFLRGEISNFTNHYRSGHFYMSLKDDKSVIKAVMFKTSAQKLKFFPQDGLKVIVTGRASIYDRDGQYQFYIEDMQPDGVGALHIAFEQLKEKLLKEGLFSDERKRMLPPYPMRIGVVTSPTGAAIADITNILGRRWPVAEILLYPVLVQGAEAPSQIRHAIEYFNEKMLADVLIIGRGGGSIEDLWAFNDETVARAVVSSIIPVVSAVGHETDFTIADFAADMRAPTPSAAAELISPDCIDTAVYIAALKNTMRQHLLKKLDESKRRLYTASSSKALRAPIDVIEIYRMRLDQNNTRLFSLTNMIIKDNKSRFAALAAGLDALSPLKVLSRGYAIPSTREGVSVSTVNAVEIGDNIDLRLHDGLLQCSVNFKEKL